MFIFAKKHTEHIPLLSEHPNKRQENPGKELKHDDSYHYILHKYSGLCKILHKIKLVSFHLIIYGILESKTRHIAGRKGMFCNEE